MIILRVLRFIAGKLALLALSFFVFFMASAWLVLTTIGSEQTVSGWLVSSGVYETFPSTLFDLIEHEARQDSQNGQAVNTLIDSGVVELDPLRQITSNNYDQAALQPQAEAALSGFYAWVRSESDRPQFSVTLSENAPQFIDEMRQELTATFAELPSCSDPRDAENVFNLLTATCIPDNVIVSEQIDSFLFELADFESPVEFNDAPLTAVYTGDQLYDDVIDPDGLFIQDSYATAQTVLRVFPFAAALALIAALLLAKDYWSGMKSVGGTFISSGLSLGLSAIFLALGSRGIASFFANQPSEQVAIIAEGFLNDFLQIVASDVATRMGIVTAILLVIGVSFWGVGAWLQRHKTKTTESDVRPQSQQKASEHAFQNAENEVPVSDDQEEYLAALSEAGDSNSERPAAPSPARDEQTVGSSNERPDAS